MSAQAQEYPFLSIDVRLRWLVLVVQIFLLLPFVGVIAPWLLALCVVCLLWRVLLNVQLSSAPSMWLKVLLFVIVVIGLLIEGIETAFSLDITVSFFVSMFVMKSLELRHRRDLIILIYLSFIVIACVFFQEQSLLMSLYLLLCVVLVLVLLIRSHSVADLNIINTQGVEESYQVAMTDGQVLYKSIVIALQAFPVMLFCIFFVPRIDPLWSVPLSESKAYTGMSDAMQPGSVAKLLRSDELVFRAQFLSAVPAMNQLYWRAFVLSDFDGVEWRADAAKRAGMLDGNFFAKKQKNLNRMPVLLADVSSKESENIEYIPQISALGNASQYQIILEPSGQTWLYSLAIGVLVDAANSELNAELSHAFALFSEKPVQARVQYQVNSFLDYQAEMNLSAERFSRETALPKDSNSQAFEMANRWFVENQKNPRQFVNYILQWFSENEFFYTLEAPVVSPKRSVDEFLFGTRKGFCEHYASAFVFLLRSAGIPARVVTGYLGGAVLPQEKLVTVRQFDAHAWAEWWSEDQGWVRVDPTAAVSPERVLSGSESALSNQAGFLADTFTILPRGHMRWLNALRLQWDGLNYQWNRWALGFDEQERQGLLIKMLGDLNIKVLAKAALLLMSCVALLLFLMFQVPRWLQRVAPSFWVNHYKKMQRLLPLNASGEYMSPSEWGQEIIVYYPELELEVAAYVRCFNHLEYSNFNHSAAGRQRWIRAHRKYSRILEIQLLLRRIRNALNAYKAK